MTAILTPAQIEVLKMLQFETTEEELFALKKTISKFLADRLKTQLEKDIQDNGYSKEHTDAWTNEHLRTTYK